jgi:sugar phosphate isomerase/epimerase
VTSHDISLSIYSFGYAAGFLTDRRQEAAAPIVDVDNIAEFAARFDLGGIEVPIDRYFSIDHIAGAETFISRHLQDGLRVALDLETFDPAYIRALLPVVERTQLGWVRIKMSGMYGGNRYKEPRFAEWMASFAGGLRDLIPDLKAAGVRLLIENHQDLGADDLVAIINRTSPECVGINWDVGNSLAVLDTPESFLAKTHSFIGNVHLKDYQLYRLATGFAMKRCALGAGVVGLDTVIPQLRQSCGAIPMAIELGAQNARFADVFTRQYWDAYEPYSVANKVEFFAFLNRNLRDGDHWKSLWEQGAPGATVIASEIEELERSVAFLRSIPVLSASGAR